jgi:outer membrane protein OmpA-like peptidoglycan-associated protein
MWRLAVAAVVGLIATAALANDAPDQGSAVAGNVSGAKGRVVDLLPAAPKAFAGRVVDLIVKSDTVAGKTQSLEVKETNTEIRIELSADILFDFDKADIKPAAADALKQVATLIRAHPGKLVRIGGYTDAKGSDPYNQKLSERRAASVKTWLAVKEGLSSVKFQTAGYGAANPVAPNINADGSDNPDGRQRNRRVELIISK